ncbi:VOC family protein [Rhodococcus sp. BP-252]|uniref:VOC domain-containing protein n=1 Tax=Rhodococcoides kyotonense TaxID=398843 RepID=A0A177YA55_9NOCA|nr:MULTISPECIES: VOC family protein [Rhodococcus]MBY6413543.1 VOC family protein [Rhodococcus sp. BP-320]MBY6418261.1 VOC family protein [Rhodococcus sp. BP-321]MBY6422675.1 VOC family protein [Rhodococcus sp. BP-324]MBY6428206.1 VOC family protein [Rhodococcus sp. BP-323]MBY6433384.1 VOC family protein [Rhodococcus sp. BP-322]
MTTPDRSGSQIDHLNVGVSDLSASAAFYGAALAPLGITEIMRVPAGTDQLPMIAFGWADRKPFFWIVDAPGAQIGPHTHLAFTAADHDTVDAFHVAALAAGAVELRPPGLQPEYHASYYGAFVRDLNGIDLEAVCHR